MRATHKWGMRIGYRKDLHEIEQDCRQFLSMNATDPFDLQACATASEGITDDDNVLLQRITGELNGENSVEDERRLKSAEKMFKERFGLV